MLSSFTLHTKSTHYASYGSCMKNPLLFCCIRSDDISLHKTVTQKSSGRQRWREIVQASSFPLSFNRDLLEQSPGPHISSVDKDWVMLKWLLLIHVHIASFKAHVLIKSRKDVSGLAWNFHSLNSPGCGDSNPPFVHSPDTVDFSRHKLHIVCVYFSLFAWKLTPGSNKNHILTKMLCISQGFSLRYPILPTVK